MSDISGHWAEGNIRSLADIGVISGYEDGTFKPNNSITIAEFGKIIVCSMGSAEKLLQEGYWASNYIEYGCNKGYFDIEDFKEPDRHITRVDAVKMLMALLNEHYDVNIYEFLEDINDYQDMSETQTFDMLRAYTSGLITGFPDGNFGHDLYITRAEACTLILRAIELSARRFPVSKRSEYSITEAEEFIQPEIIIQYNTNPYEPIYFTVKLDNYNDFDEDYKFLIEFVNYPQLNLREQNWGEWVKIRINEWRDADYVKRNGGILFSLPKGYYTTRENKESFKIVAGMKIKYLVVCSTGDAKRFFPGEITVRAKEFK